MDREAHEHAILAKASYDYYLENPEFAQNELLEYGFNDHIIDDSLSDDHAITIAKPDGSAVISYRGTHFSVDDSISDNDLLADGLIFAGYHKNPIMRFGLNAVTNLVGRETRFQRAENHYKKVKEIYPEVTLTGHSLGGTIASYVGRRNNEKTYMYNKGSSPIIDPLFSSGKKIEGHKHYTTGTDPISLGAKYDTQDEVIVIPVDEKKDYLTHSLNYFLPKRVGRRVKDEKGKENIILSSEPDYLMPIRLSDGRKVTFCQLYPNDELCGGEGS